MRKKCIENILYVFFFRNICNFILTFIPFCVIMKFQSIFIFFYTVQGFVLCGDFFIKICCLVILNKIVYKKINRINMRFIV